MAVVKCFDRKRNVTYVYDSQCFFDKDQGKYRYKRRLIGKLDEDGNVVPTGPRGGYRPKREKSEESETPLEPLRPGRKKKEKPVQYTDETLTKQLSEAKERILRLEKENATLRSQNAELTAAYNRLVKGLKAIITEPIGS